MNQLVVGTLLTLVTCQKVSPSRRHGMCLLTLYVLELRGRHLLTFVGYICFILHVYI